MNKKDEVMVRKECHFPPKLLKALTQIAQEEGESVNNIIRKACRKLIIEKTSD